VARLAARAGLRPGPRCDSASFFQASERAGESHAQRFTEMLELATLADELGFDVAWLAEIHFGAAFSLLASPLMAVPRSPSVRSASGSAPR